LQRRFIKIISTVTYTVPDASWDSFQSLRVLTGRDFDPEGLAVLSNECALLGDELGPFVFGFNPETGVVTTPLIRTPDLNKRLKLHSTRTLSSNGDKVHCSDLDNLKDCLGVSDDTVRASDYRLVSRSGGFEGFSAMPDGTVIGMLEKSQFLDGEPGVRTYRIDAGDCDDVNPPSFTDFLGFYKVELGGNKISEISPIPNSNDRLVVFERNDFPPYCPETKNHLWPAPAQPHFKLCIIDLNSTDDDKVFNRKKCFLDFQDISDPWDVDYNGIYKYAYIQLGPEALLVVDDYCFVAGQDTNFPTVNQFGLDPSQVPDWQETMDTRFIVVCFKHPIFNADYPIFD